MKEQIGNLAAGLRIYREEVKIFREQFGPRASTKGERAWAHKQLERIYIFQIMMTTIMMINQRISGAATMMLEWMSYHPEERWNNGLNYLSKANIKYGM